jgi:hypothetical protein
MTKVLFLDIDGVVLPGRAYMLPNQTKPIVKTFDPCAVSMINEACRKQKRKIVIHSSWIRHFWGDDLEGDVHGHCIAQGINADLFHEDLYCNREMHWRYDRVRDWLARHKEVTDFVIVDDEPALKDDAHLAPNLVLTDFDEGITMKQFRRLLDGTFPREIGG